MEHLETYPNVYLKNKTYIPIDWDMSNLEDEIFKIINNYKDYIPLIKKAQKIYKKTISDPDHFVDHFLSIFEVNDLN
jgi:hypothetical protein